MNLKPEELLAYRQALKDRVCSICKKLGFEETCGVGPEGECPFDVHLARLVEAVLSTPRSANIVDYLPRIRELVCRHCDNQSDRGVCKVRDMAYCGLDSFIVLVVQTIEDVEDRLKASKAPAA